MMRYTKQVVDADTAAAKVAGSLARTTLGINPAVATWDFGAMNIGAESFRAGIGHSLKPHILEMMQRNFTSTGRRKKYPYLTEVWQNDGTGGKSQFFSLIGTPEVMRQHAHDLVAMVVDDLRGWPTLFANEICCQRLTDQNRPLYDAAMEGVVTALKSIGMINITGETAVMRNQITGIGDNHSDDQFYFTWAGFGSALCYHGPSPQSRIILPGMPIIGFMENGMRCNGSGYLTDLLLAYYGNIQSILTDPGAMAMVRDLTVPSVIYGKAMARVMGWNADATIGEPLADVRGVYNITGGGLRKLQALPANIGAYLGDLPEPTSVLKLAQHMSWLSTDVPKDLKLTDEDALTSFHPGCGMMCVAANLTEGDKLIKAVGRYGIMAKFVGETTDYSTASGLPPFERFRVISRYNLKNGKVVYPLRKTA